MTMLITIFIALVVLALFHYVYEGILAPGYKHEARMRLFALRDELRLLKIEYPDQISDELFHEMQATLNRQIRYFDGFTLVNILSAIWSLRNDTEVEEQVHEFYLRLHACRVRRLSGINQESLKVFGRTIGINSGGWLSVILPFYLLIKILELVGYLFNQVDKKRLDMRQKMANEASKILEAPPRIFISTFDDCPV